MAIRINKGPSLGKYYYSKEDIVYGPIPLEDLLRYIDADTLVYYEGIKWTEAKNLPEFKSIINTVKTEEQQKQKFTEEYNQLSEPSKNKSTWPVIIILLILGIVFFIYYGSTTSRNIVDTPAIDTSAFFNTDTVSTTPQIIKYNLDDIYNSILSCTYTDASQLEKLLLHELVSYKNELLARHGFVFEDENITQYYQTTGWYSPVNNYLIATSQFNDFEKYNFKLIEDQLKKNNEVISALIQRLYQSIVDKSFQANLFFADEVEKYITKSNIAFSEIDDEILAHYSEFVNSRYSFSNPFELTILNSESAINFVSYTFHYEVERVSKQKQQVCDVTIRLGLNADYKIVYYEEEKIENLTFSEVSIVNTDSSSLNQ